MRVGKVSKNLKEFLKFVKTNFSFSQGAFLLSPSSIWLTFLKRENQPNESGFGIVY
jgi:hypothetical protein